MKRQNDPIRRGVKIVYNMVGLKVKKRQHFQIYEFLRIIFLNKEGRKYFMLKTTGNYEFIIIKINFKIKSSRIEKNLFEMSLVT